MATGSRGEALLIEIEINFIKMKLKEESLCLPGVYRAELSLSLFADRRRVSGDLLPGSHTEGGVISFHLNLSNSLFSYLNKV